MKETYTLLLFFCCIVYVCNGEIDVKTNCDSDKCYRNVNTTHENLLQLLDQLNSTSLSTKITKPYSLKPFEELTKQVEKIGQESKKIVSKLNSINDSLNQNRENLTKNENDVDLMFQKLANISQINETSSQLHQILKKMQVKYDTVKELVDLQQNVSRTCGLAEDTYTELGKDISGTFTHYKKVRKNYEKLKNKTININETLSETLQNAIKNKEDFEQIKFPDNVAEGFLNQTVGNFNSTINYLKDNSDILKNLLEASYKLLRDQIKNQSDTVQKSLLDIQRDVDSMNEELEKYDQEIIKDNFTLTINNDSIELIALIENELNMLEDKLNKIDLTKEEKNLLSKEYGTVNEIQKKTEELAKYTMLLDDLIPASDKELQKIESEISDFRISIYLIEQSKEIENQLSHLKKLRDEAIKLTCNITSTNILT